GVLPQKARLEMSSGSYGRSVVVTGVSRRDSGTMACQKFRTPFYRVRWGVSKPTLCRATAPGEELVARELDAQRQDDGRHDPDRDRQQVVVVDEVAGEEPEQAGLQRPQHTAGTDVRGELVQRE